MMGQPLPLATTRAQRAEPEDVWEGKLAKGALHLVDDSSKESGAFRVTWKPQPDTEIVVEATAASLGSHRPAARAACTASCRRQPASPRARRQPAIPAPAAAISLRSEQAR